jgi:adenylate cyclase
LSETLREAFACEVRRGVQLAIVGNTVVLGLYLVALVIQAVTGASTGVYGRWNAIMSVVSLLSGITLVSLTYYFASRSRRPLLWCCGFMILSLLSFLQIAGFGILPAPLAGYPRYLTVERQDVLSLAFALALFALPLSRAFVAWTAALYAVVYSAAIAIVLLHAPNAHYFFGSYRADAATLKAAMDPWTFQPAFLAVEMVLLGMFALLLVLAIGSGRRFVVRRTRAEAARAALSRFLPAAVAAQIASRQNNHIDAARRRAAILFVLPEAAEGALPDLLALHDFYVRAESVLFAHDAVLDRFTGGPVMASFGLLHDDDDVTAKAIASAQAVARTFAGRVRIGVHCGVVVAGELGSAHSRYFGAVGGAINIARRVLDEAVARQTPIVVTGDVMRQAGAEARATGLGPALLRGSEAPVELWAVTP